MSIALFLSILLVAACGLIYELIAGTVASYLVGDSVFQFSTVIGTYLFAMGIGSFLSRYVRGNLARQFPDGLAAEIDTSTWERQPVFGWLASLGVDDEEMWRVFNMGLGFAAVIAARLEHARPNPQALRPPAAAERHHFPIHLISVTDEQRSAVHADLLIREQTDDRPAHRPRQILHRQC